MLARILITALIAVLLGPISAKASAMDWRIYFTADTTGALSEAAATAYLFEINGEDDLAGISEVIRKGAVDTISALASGKVEHWQSGSFLSVSTDLELNQTPLAWAVIVDGMGWQTGRVENYGGGLTGSGNTERHVGYETNPETGANIDFALLQASDEISLSSFATVPEPTSAFIFLIGIASLALKRCAP